MAVPALLFGLFLGASWVAVFAIAQGRVDFRQLYAAGYMVRTHHGHELYDYAAQKHFQDTLVSPAERALPFVRPAYQALLFAPLSVLPYVYAYIAWFLLNLVLLHFWLRLFRPLTHSLRKVWKFLPLALVMGFIPILLSLLQGQDSVLLLVILSAALILLERERAFAAGAMLAVGLFKFQLVLPIALLFFLWRRWRFCFGFVCGGVVLGAISVWLTGITQAKIYLISMVSFGSGTRSTGLRFPIPLNFMPNFHGLVATLGGAHLSVSAVSYLTLILSLLTLVGVWWRHSQNWSSSDEIAVAIDPATLVSYYLFWHDLTALILPIQVMLDRTVLRESSGTRADRYLLRASTLIFLAPVLLLSAPEKFYVVSICVLAFLAITLYWLNARNFDFRPLGSLATVNNSIH